VITHPSATPRICYGCRSWFSHRKTVRKAETFILLLIKVLVGSGHFQVYAQSSLSENGCLKPQMYIAVNTSDAPSWECLTLPKAVIRSNDSEGREQVTRYQGTNFWYLSDFNLDLNLPFFQNHLEHSHTKILFLPLKLSIAVFLSFIEIIR